MSGKQLDLDHTQILETNQIQTNENRDNSKDSKTKTFRETMKEVLKFLEINALKSIQTPLQGTSLKLTPDGSRIVFGSRSEKQGTDNNSKKSGARLAVIDLKSEEIVMDQAISLKDILAIAITNDNQHIYAAGGECIIFKLELSSLTKLDLFEGHSGAVNDLILSPDDSHLFSVSDDGSLRKWQKNLKTSEILIQSEKSLCTLDLNIESHSLFTGGKSGILYIFQFLEDMTEGKVEKTIKVKNPISACRVSKKSFVAVGDEKGNVFVYRLSFWDLCYQFSMTDHISDIDISPNEEVLIAASKNTNIKIWFLIKKKEIEYNGHLEWVRTCSFMKDYSKVVSISDDRNIKIWKIPEPQNEIEYFFDEKTQVENIWFSRCFLSIKAVVWKDSGKAVVDLTQDKDCEPFEFTKDPDALVAVNSEKDFLICASHSVKGFVDHLTTSNFIIEIFDLKEKITVKTGLVQKNVQILQVSSSLKYIFIGTDSKVHVVSFESFLVLKVFHLNQENIECLEVCSNDDYFLILRSSQVCYFKINIEVTVEGEGLDFRHYDDDLRNAKIAISKNSQYFFMLASTFFEVVDSESLITIVRFRKSYLGFIENCHESLMLYFENVIEIYSLETFELLTTLRKDHPISKIILSHDTTDIYLLFPSKLIKCENPLNPSNLTLLGDNSELEDFQLYLNSLLERRPTLALPSTSWVLEPVHMNLLHVFVYLNMWSTLAKLSSTPSSKSLPLMQSSEGYSPLTIALKMNYSECVNLLIKLLITRLNEFKPQEDISRHLMFSIIENDLIALNLSGYSKLHKFYNQTFRVDSSAYLPNFASIEIKLPKLIKDSGLIIDHSRFGLKESEDQNSVIFKKTIFRLYLEMGSSKSIEFLKSLEKCRNLKVFETKIISLLLLDKWGKVRWAMLAQGVIFFSYLILLAVYNASENARNETFLLSAFFFNVVLFAYESVFIVINFFEYFRNFFNVVDLIRFFMMFVYCVLVWSGFFDVSFNRSTNERFMLAVLLFISWIRGLTYFRMIKATRYLVNLLFQVVVDIAPFLFIIFYSLITFSLVFRAFDGNPKAEFFPYLTESYLIILGGWNNPINDDFHSFVLLTATLLNPIITLNLLIAVISDTFEKVQKKQIVADLLELVEMIIEIETLMIWNRGKNLKRYVHVIDTDLVFEGESSELGFLVLNLKEKVFYFDFLLKEHDKAFEKLKSQTKKFYNEELSSLQKLGSLK